MKYKQWNLRPPAPTGALQALEGLGLSPLCACVLYARGVDSPEKARAFLSDTPFHARDPFLLKDMDRAVARISQALASGEQMAVYGDYDVDGITSTCLLTERLRELGGDVVSYIPDRMEEGYGLNPTAISALHRQGVGLIITVDCGITAVGEVEYARSLGVDVVITDHHQCKDTLPQAVAVVDPRREDCPYPFKELAGVGVALKLALALAPPEARQEVMERYGELAAVGTVADVMVLADENRSLVRTGLDLLACTQRPGLHALLQEVLGRDGRQPTSATIGFSIAPRLNASGRIQHASLALELLLTREEQRGVELASALGELNRERQAMEQEIIDSCQAMLEQDPQLLGPALVLAGENWHQGVIGIVASRLAEQYGRPTLMISLDREKGKGKGSCRSYGEFNLFAALERCAPLLEGFGGHAKAAGLTIQADQIPALRQAIGDLVAEHTRHTPMVSTLDIDAEIDCCRQLTCQAVDQLDLLEPTGHGNERPVFLARSMYVVSCGDVGGGRHLKLRVRRDGEVLDAIFFSANTASCQVSPGDRLDLAFTLHINEFRGSRTPQLQLCDLRPAPPRPQLELELFHRLQAGQALSRWEAGLLLPQRPDCAQLWRYLARTCTQPDTAVPLEQLARHALAHSGGAAYGKALVGLHVMAQLNLIRFTLSGHSATICLNRTAAKADLEQAPMMRQLRAMLE